MDNEFKMTVCNQDEEDFFISNLTKTDNVLEWGSGKSTNHIAAHCKHLCSIENNHTYFTDLAKDLSPNVHLEYVPENKSPKPGHDGTKEDFKDYVERAKYLANRFGKFDVIFIDGRARVACAEICAEIGHKDTLVFIHDYNHPDKKYLREEYYPAENYLERLGGEFTMWKFKIKNPSDKEKLYVETEVKSTKQKLKYLEKKK